MSEMTRRQRTAAAAVWVCVVVLTLPGILLSVLAWRYLATSDAVSNLAGLPAAILYATLGAVSVASA